jgi:hypothetical protein
MWLFERPTDIAAICTEHIGERVVVDVAVGFEISNSVDALLVSPGLPHTVTNCLPRLSESRLQPMAPFQAALDALKTAATNGKTSKEVQDTVDRVSSSLTLLVGSFTSFPTSILSINLTRRNCPLLL